jgi:peptidoglycan/LPS O-acetylase OafA/YrhL
VKRIPELDGLRGIAILLVIGCHYEVFARQFWGLPKYGWVGVDLFFVLSGFLITSVLLNLREQVKPFKTFYGRRIRRIIPPYVGFLVLLYLVTAALGDFTLYKRGTILRNVLFMQSFDSVSGVVKILLSGKGMSFAHIHLGPAIAVLQQPVSNAWGVLWSLSIEEWYYLLWAPVVLWLKPRQAFVCGICICLASFVMRWLGSQGTGAYYSIYHRFDAPVFGSLLALMIASNMPRRRLRSILIFSGIIATATLAIVLVSMGNVLGREIRQNHSFMVFGVPSLSLLAATAIGICVTRSGAPFLFLLRSKPLCFMGTISYTLYLLHGFVYLCFVHFFFPTWTVSLTALSCAVLLSWASWTYFERPILEGGREASLPRVQTEPELTRVA